MRVSFTNDNFFNSTLPRFYNTNQNEMSYGRMSRRPAIGYSYGNAISSKVYAWKVSLMANKYKCNICKQMINNSHTTKKTHDLRAMFEDEEDEEN